MAIHEQEMTRATSPLLMRQVEEEEEENPEEEAAAPLQRAPLSLAEGAGDTPGAVAARLQLAHDQSPNTAQRAVLQLQRRRGNQYVQRALAVQRRGDGAGEVAPEVEAAIQRQRGGGQSLDKDVRAQMEPFFGVDFSRVRVHTGSEADTLNRAVSARAFTTDSDIFFRDGEYAPNSSAGRELLAHELTHVVQQGGGMRRRMAVSSPEDAEEREAEDVARTLVGRKSERTFETHEARQERHDGSLSVQRLKGPLPPWVRMPRVLAQSLLVTHLSNEELADEINTIEIILVTHSTLLEPHEMKLLTVSQKALQKEKVKRGHAVEVVALPKKQQSIKGIVIDSLDAVEGMLQNYIIALANFETAVTYSSKEEADIKSVGVIVAGEVCKFITDKLKGYVTELLYELEKMVLGEAKLLKDIFELTKAINEAIEKEQKRSAGAVESGTLGDFIFDLRSRLTTIEKTLAIRGRKEEYGEAAEVRYRQLDSRAREPYRVELALRKSRLLKALNSEFSAESLFRRIVEQWIRQTKAPGEKDEGARLEISLDKDWQVISASINAPRGSRLAQRLLKLQGGSIDLNELHVPRYITWFPLSDQKDSELVRCFARVSSEGIASEIGAWVMGTAYLQKFVGLLRTKPLPRTAKLSGHKTE